jgi:hypothetical protein
MIRIMTLTMVVLVRLNIPNQVINAKVLLLTADLMLLKSPLRQVLGIRAQNAFRANMMKPKFAGHGPDLAIRCRIKDLHPPKIICVTNMLVAISADLIVAL